MRWSGRKPQPVVAHQRYPHCVLDHLQLSYGLGGNLSLWQPIRGTQTVCWTTCCSHKHWEGASACESPSEVPTLCAKPPPALVCLGFPGSRWQRDPFSGSHDAVPSPCQCAWPWGAWPLGQLAGWSCVAGRVGMLQILECMELAPWRS